MTEETINNAQRLTEATTKCLLGYDQWTKDLKNHEARESLLEAVHELRKVTSRFEIDIAMHDRLALNAKPIPIPEHKSKMEKKHQKPLSEILPVAEIRDAREKRKVAIQNMDDAEGDEFNTSDVSPKDESIIDLDSGEGLDDGIQPHSNEGRKQPQGQQRPMRRKKRVDTSKNT